MNDDLDGPNRLLPGSDETGSAASRPEELPPVQPPSAGYIVQLFLIPALIVAAVIGVWALFGKLAESETDWKQLVSELGSSNEHRRWRAALGLAQVLRNQQISPDENSVALADQPEVAEALSDLLKQSLDSPSTLDEDIKHQEFLARTLGSLNADEIVLPVLAEALEPERDSDVRKSSLMSLAMIAGRHFEQQAETAELLEPDRVYEAGRTVVTLRRPLEQPTIGDESVWQQLTLAAQDEDPGIRHLATFVFALISGEKAIAQLKLMLLDGDAMTQANAAVGLARNGQTDGVEAIRSLLADSARPVEFRDTEGLSAAQLEEEQERRSRELQRVQFEGPVILSNCLRAVDSIWVALDESQRDTLRPVLVKLATDYRAADIQLQAKKLVERFDGSSDSR